MKNYFKFNLTGKQLLPVWLAFMALVVVPYFYFILRTAFLLGSSCGVYHDSIADAVKMMCISVIPIVIIGLVIYFYIGKMSIESTEYKEESFLFDGKAGRFLGLVLKGILLSVITIGFYIPWFIENIYDFFAEKTSYKSNRFSFLGTGVQLLKIALLYYILPLIVVSIVMEISFGSHPEYPLLRSILMQVITLFIAIPFMYLRYKWMVDVRYKEYVIQWDTDFWSACKMILIQTLLSIVTIGIYYPLAIVRLYKYFAEKTVAVSDVRTKKFGYDIEPKDDFLFIWGQLLLTIITIGIYYPWAYCKVANRILSKTYVEDTEVTVV